MQTQIIRERVQYLLTILVIILPEVQLDTTVESPSPVHPILFLDYQPHYPAYTPTHLIQLWCWQQTIVV